MWRARPKTRKRCAALRRRGVAQHVEDPRRKRCARLRHVAPAGAASSSVACCNPLHSAALLEACAGVVCCMLQSVAFCCGGDVEHEVTEVTEMGFSVLSVFFCSFIVYQNAIFKNLALSCICLHGTAPSGRR